MPEPGLNDDALRLARKHETEIKALLWRMESLEESRRVYVPQIEALVSEAKIEKAVKTALTTQRRHFFTVPQKVVGILVAIGTVVNLAITVSHHG